jgi:outer membrane protein OmpA-like peptidoglycan-associated protein/tetratricopeptide (TPR) repeat protein
MIHIIKTMKNTILILFAIFINTIAFAQDYVTRKTASEEAIQYYNEARELGNKNDYKTAVKAYEKALKVAPNFIDAQLFLADAYYALEDFDNAEKWFESVLEIDKTYNTRVIYVLGALEYRMDKFEEAIVHLEDFLTFPSKSKKLTAKAGKLLENCRFAAVAVKNPLPFTPKNLGAINTEEAEYLPCFTADGEFMLYTSRYVGQEDFFQSQKINGEWIKGINMGAPINTMDNEGAQTISADGTFLVYTVCNRNGDFGSCDLYFSELLNGKWTEPYNIDAPINTRGWESQPSLSADGRTLYFTSNRGNGKGKKDLWVTYRLRNGKWMEPQNLGDQINTNGNEESPFIHADGQTLYFRSDMHVGMGRTDLFMSTRQPDGSWSKPKNLGYPINTKADEGSLVVSLDGKTGYFASDREDSKGATDIYSFEMPEAIRPKAVTYFKAKVIDAKTRLDLQAKVELIQLSTGLTYTESMTSKNGEFLICLPAGDDYALNVSRKGYVFYSENFEFKEVNSFNEPFEKKVELQPIPKEIVVNNSNPNTKIPENQIAKSTKPTILKNVFFETGSADLKPSSKAELNKLVDLLKENSTMKIQLNGHTDNVGEPEKNQVLSLNRAVSVMNYLIENGIESNRVTAKGFGENESIATNETAEGRKQNRRTEFIIIE